VVLRKKTGKSGGRVLQPRWIEKKSAERGAHRRGALDGDEEERTTSDEVEKWRMAYPSLSGAEIRPASTDTRGLRSGGSVAVRWREAAQLSRARVAIVRAAVERFWTLTSGPSAILNFQWFSITQTLKFQTVTFPMFKIHQNLHRDSLKYKEQFSFLSQLRISPEFKVINSRTNSKLNLPWIFKGPKPFWKNLINSLKFHVYWI
jgi:hypothetical protein